MKKITSFLVAITLGFSFNSCDKKENDEPDNESHNLNYPAMLISNQGNFSSATANVGLYSLEDEVYSGELFKNKNNENLGNTLQSSAQIGDKIYLVLNGSGKIEVVNKNDFSSVAMISNLNSPRYICRVSPDVAYVSDFTSGTIHVLNTNTNIISGSIDFPSAYSENMLKIGDEVFVAAPFTDKVYIINIDSHIVTDSITLSYGTNDMVLDAENKLWVFSMGDYTETHLPALHRVDPQSREVEKTMAVSGPGFPGNVAVSSDKNTVYVLTNNLYALSLDAEVFPGQPFIPSEGKSFSAMAVNPNTDEIAIADAKDYSQAGDIYRYTNSGSLITSFTADVTPGHILFVE